MVTPRRSFTLLATIACIGIPLAGCGGSSDSNEDAAATTTVPDTNASQKPPRKPTAPPASAKGSTDGPSPEERQRDTALVEQVMRDLIEGMNAQDAGICTRLFDRHLVDAAEREEETAKCESTIANHPGGVELVRIESVRFRQSASGTESLASILTRQGDQPPARLAFHLMKSDGAYKIDRGVPAE